MSEERRTASTVLILLPSLRISGGVKEAIRLAEDLTSAGNPVEIIVLWRSKHDLPCGDVPVHHLSSFVAERSTAALQFPLLLVRFFLLRQLRAAPGKHIALVLTHFSTFPFAWITPRLKWFCFNQDIEWMFVRDGLPRILLRWFILATSRRSKVFTTNAFVEGLYLQENIHPIGRLSIWPSAIWQTSEHRLIRDVDVVVLLRRGQMKRLDLYVDILVKMKQAGLTSYVVTPDADVFEEVGRGATYSAMRPGDEELASIYQRSKVFLLLSDTEGFSLPPVEAMGSGCVPLCRDSGGPRCYMSGPLRPYLIPLNASIDDVFVILQSLLADANELSAMSSYVREAFAAGVAATRSEREACIATLTRMFQEG